MLDGESERMSSGPDRASVMAKIAVIGLIAAVVIAGFPVIFTIADRDNPGGESGLLFLFTVPIGAIIGVPSLVLAIIVSIIGNARAWRTSNVRRILTITALVLVLLLLVSIVGTVLSWDESLLALFQLMGYVGLVLFVITGWTGLGKKTPIVESAG